MTTAFGADPIKDENGLVTVGTTSEDLRQIWGSLYSAGLISGGVVTRSTTEMKYFISNGVAAFPMVVDNSAPYKPENQRTVIGPIPQTTLTVTTPAAGTSRTDIVYAQQLTPADDQDATVVVRVGPTLPPRAVLLNGFLVTSSNVNTQATTPNQNVKYSIPYGASMGRLVNMTNMFNNVFTVAASGTQPRSSLGTGTFWLPTDRNIKVSLTVQLSANGAVGFDNSKYCEAGYEVFLDGIKQFTWTTGGLHQAWQEISFEGYLTAQAGNRSVSVSHFRNIGPGTPRGRASTGNPYGRVIVEDLGPAV